jgi:hypothetical protein
MPYFRRIRHMWQWQRATRLKWNWNMCFYEPGWELLKEGPEALQIARRIDSTIRELSLRHSCAREAETLDRHQICRENWTGHLSQPGQPKAARFKGEAMSF